MCLAIEGDDEGFDAAGFEDDGGFEGPDGLVGFAEPVDADDFVGGVEEALGDVEVVVADAGAVADAAGPGLEVELLARWHG